MEHNVLHSSKAASIKKVASKSSLKLPVSVVSSADITRLLRELSQINDEMVQLKVRAANNPLKIPKTTTQLEDLAKENNINLLKESARNHLATDLKDVIKHCPSLHMSFAAEPSPKAVGKILLWLRENIHEQALLTIGLQPTIAAGLVMRTPNLLFDMSLRQYLQQQEPYLTQMIKEMARAK